MGCAQPGRLDAGRGNPLSVAVAALASCRETASRPLEILLPAGWLLCGGMGYRLTVLGGEVWLTDVRQQDIWLRAGHGEWLGADALVEAASAARLTLGGPPGAFPAPTRITLEAGRRRLVIAPGKWR